MAERESEIARVSRIQSIQITFGEGVELTAENERRLVSVIDAICNEYEQAHPGRVMWPAGIGSLPTDIWSDEPTFDDSVFSVDCAERERFEDEKIGKPFSYEKEVIAEAIDRLGWPEINRFNAELRKGQSIDEDAGGFMLRAIGRLFGIRRRRDPVVTYQDAARALLTQTGDA